MHSFNVSLETYRSFLRAWLSPTPMTILSLDCSLTLRSYTSSPTCARPWRKHAKTCLVLGLLLNRYQYQCPSNRLHSRILSLRTHLEHLSQYWLAVWQFSAIYLQQGFQGLSDVPLFRSCSNQGGISSSSSPSSLLALTLRAMGCLLGFVSDFVVRRLLALALAQMRRYPRSYLVIWS